MKYDIRHVVLTVPPVPQPSPAYLLIHLDSDHPLRYSWTIMAAWCMDNMEYGWIARRYITIAGVGITSLLPTRAKHSASQRP